MKNHTSVRYAAKLSASLQTSSRTVENTRALSLLLVISADEHSKERWIFEGIKKLNILTWGSCTDHFKTQHYGLRKVYYTIQNSIFWLEAAALNSSKLNVLTWDSCTEQFKAELLTWDRCKIRKMFKISTLWSESSILYISKLSILTWDSCKSSKLFKIKHSNLRQLQNYRTIQNVAFWPETAVLYNSKHSILTWDCFAELFKVQHTNLKQL